MLFFIGVIAVSLSLTVGLLAFGHFLQQRVSFLHDPVYVPSTDQAVKTMLELARLQPGMRVVDFGSGDGRLVVACAEQGCQAVGYEIDPLLVWKSRRWIRERGLEARAEIKWQSFWSADLSDADVVLLYTTASIMPRLAAKLRAELKKGAVIVSQRFIFSDWKPVRKKGEVFVYKV